MIKTARTTTRLSHQWLRLPFRLLVVCIAVLLSCSVSFSPGSVPPRLVPDHPRKARRSILLSSSSLGGDEGERTRWIVLVDDEEPIRTVVGQFLLDKGFRVTTCADGRAALELVESHDSFPDCIVSDIRMPVMDGLELLANIRKTASELMHVPVVLLTAKGVTQDRIAGYNAGADAYLTKPFSPDELVAIVDNLIQRSEDLKLESKTVSIQDLQNDLAEIKDLLLGKGGGGIGNGWVERTDVFLSKDERAVLDFLSRGMMTKEIAAKTHLSTRRIEQLLTGMFRKTGVKNRTELVRWAVSTGNVE